MKLASPLPWVWLGRRSRAGRGNAFTLLEVLLAVGLVAGLLVVALFYHQQAETFRSGLLDELNRVTVVRHLMNRLTAELNTLAPAAGPLRGSAGELEFAFAAVGTEDALVGRANPGLRKASYQLPQVDDPEAPPPSLRRTERPLDAAPAAASDEETSVAPLAGAGDGITFGDLLADASGGDAAESSPPAPGSQTLDDIHFFNLRYYDGTNWVESWEARVPPLGIEVSLGFTPPEEDALPEDYAGEVFRRVIAIPVNGPVSLAGKEGGASRARSTGPSSGESSPSGPEDDGGFDSDADGFGGALFPPDEDGGSEARGALPRNRRRGGRVR